jgi:hypothetical protein
LDDIDEAAAALTREVEVPMVVDVTAELIIIVPEAEETKPAIDAAELTMAEDLVKCFQPIS